MAGPARNPISALAADTGGAALAGRSMPCHRPGRTGLHVDLDGDVFAQVLPGVAQVNTETISACSLLIDEVCIFTMASPAGDTSVRRRVVPRLDWTPVAE